MQSEYILEMKSIDKGFPGVRALDNVSLYVKSGEVHCLIGANGAGKSTLMKVLSGAYHPDGGQIFFAGEELKHLDPLNAKRKGISMIYQELSLVNELNVVENIFINNFVHKKNGSIDWKTTTEKAKRLMETYHINIDLKQKTGKLSIGQRQLVELLKCIASDSKLIVMDEPSATLSKNEFDILVQTIKDLKDKGMTIIYISHRLEELFVVGDSITILKDGKNVMTANVKELNMDGIVTAMIGKKIAEESKRVSEKSATNEVVLKAENIFTKKLKDVSLELKKGEIHGIYGLVGSGRTEVLRAFYGADKINRGEIFHNGRLAHFKNIRMAIRNGIGLLPENRKLQGLVLALPVYENISMVALKKFLKFGFIRYKGLYDVSNRFVKTLDIKTPSIKTSTRSLSGGNQQKVIIAKWLAQNCEILLVDEPTQGIDVGAKDEIYKLLRRNAKDGKSIIIVSSELEELMQVCDIISVMFDGKIVNEFKVNESSEDEILHSAIVGGSYDSK